MRHKQYILQLDFRTLILELIDMYADNYELVFVMPDAVKAVITALGPELLRAS